MNRNKRKTSGRFWEPPDELAKALKTIKSGPIYQNWLIGKEAYAELVQSLEAPLKWLKETQERIASNPSETKDSKSEGIITPPTSQSSLLSPAKSDHIEPSAAIPKEIIVVATPDSSGISADGGERAEEEEAEAVTAPPAFLVCETSSDEEEKRDGAANDASESGGTPLVERLRRPPIRSATSLGKAGRRGPRRSLQGSPSLLNSSTATVALTPTHSRQMMNQSLSAMERIFGSQRVRHLATMNEEKKKLVPFSLVKTGDKVKDAMARKEACLQERRDKIRREQDEKTAAVKARAKALEQSRQLELQRKIGGHKQTGPESRARRLQMAANRELAERRRREAKAKKVAREKAIKTGKDPKPPAKLASPRTPGPLADVSSSDDEEGEDDDGVSPDNSLTPLHPRLHRRPPTPPKSQRPNSNSHLLSL